MPLINLDVKIDKKRWFFSQEWLRGKWPSIKKTSMQAVAREWMRTIFDRHFTPGNESRYQMQPRNAFYKNVVKKQEGQGQGKYVSLLLKEQSRRWLRTSATVTATQDRATLRMQGPPYFANPFIGRMKKEVTTKAGMKRVIEINIGRQPDKVKELTTINEADRETLREFFHSDFEMRIKLAISAA